MRTSRTAPGLTLTLTLACSEAVVPAATDTGSTSTASTSSPTDDPTTTTPTTTTDATTTTGPLDPPCCGCLCIDPAISCNADICTPEGGGPAPLQVEAGFLQVAAHTISVRIDDTFLERTAPASRLWYAFRPADDDPASRPLAVFFNGGPGLPTAVLFGTNTGAWTFDPAVAGDAVIAENPHAWTRLANLLYVDPPQTGYSYDLAPDTDLPFIPEHDAAVITRFLLAFLAAHPQLRATPVILVGQSWGGVRATLIGHHLLFAGDLLGGPAYRDPDLHARVQEHLAAAFPHLPVDDPATAARQFGHRVLIQPVISTGLEYDTLLPRTPYEDIAVLQGCIDSSDPYQCDEPGGWTVAHNNAIVRAVVRPGALSHALGLDITSIAWMHADARSDAIVRAPMEGHGTENEDALRAIFGPLATGDHYYMRHHIRAPLPDTFYAAHPGYARMFVRTLPYVRTFVTDAGKDSLVYGPDLPAQLAYHDDLVAAATHDPAPVADEPRPGRILVDYRPELGLPDPSIEIRFPHYAAAGHTVTARAPGELLADVIAWYAAE